MAASNPDSSWVIKVAANFGFPLRRFDEMFNKVILRDCFHGNWSKENIIKCYKDHIQHVKETCPKDQLLVFEVSEGWEPLCKFLNKPVPDVPFPRVNDTEDFQRKTNYIRLYGHIILFTSLFVLACLFFYAVKLFCDASMHESARTAVEL